MLKPGPVKLGSRFHSLYAHDLAHRSWADTVRPGLEVRICECGGETRGTGFNPAQEETG